MATSGQRTLGLLGGMSWQSTEVYYRLINEAIARRLGGLHSAELLLSSLDMAPVAALQHQDEWASLGQLLNERARALVSAGAEALLICTNTMHRVADATMDGLGVPLLHIVDAVAEAARADGHRHLGLLGTRFTMESDLFPARLVGTGIDIQPPPSTTQRQMVHEVIYAELCRGHISDSSRRAYLRVLEDLEREGCDAVVLGCTEIGLLLSGEVETPLPLIDSTEAHVRAAVAFALGAAQPAGAG